MKRGRVNRYKEANHRVSTAASCGGYRHIRHDQSRIAMRGRSIIELDIGIHQPPGGGGGTNERKNDIIVPYRPTNRIRPGTAAAVESKASKATLYKKLD